ncbi:hypothetical protein [Saccharothrix sp. NRRL B-16348]|uniref:hypothetical protein n=1 Tax=Saccharothrix sp. NRRL B-16348 TaxID=1415542 RepID=UPI001E4A33B0|nr:hypothetical protein [Saccharothrix sp. NRRL B-16348]
MVDSFTHAPSVMSHGVPATVTGGGGGAGCGSGVFVVSVVGAGDSDVGAAEDDVGAAEEAGEEDGEEETEEEGDVTGPDASDVPQAVARKAIATRAALRIAQTPQDRAVY